MPSQLAMRLSFASRRDFFLISLLKKRPTSRLPLRGISRSSFCPVCRPVITPRTVMSSRKRDHDGYQRGRHPPEQSPQGYLRGHHKLEQTLVVIKEGITSCNRPRAHICVCVCVCGGGVSQSGAEPEWLSRRLTKTIAAIAHCHSNLVIKYKFSIESVP
jgi:hypothetical protein